MQNKNRVRKKKQTSGGERGTRINQDPQLLPVQKNDLIEARVDGQGNGGEGILRVEGFPLFIPGALPGERVRAKVLKVSKSHGFARMEEVLEGSGQRQDPPCPYFGRCGGCSLQHQQYQAQLDFKTGRVRDCFIRIGGIFDPDVRPAIGMDTPWRYRNKVQMPVGREKGELRVGFYKGRSHEIIDIGACLIQNHPSDRIAAALRRWIADFEVPTLDWEEEITPGAIRHLLIREGRTTGQLLAVVVATSPDVPHLDQLVDNMRQAVPQLTGLILNVNARVTNRVLGSENRTLWGEEAIEDTIGAVKYRISPHSFFQVNPEMTRQMYDKVAELAGLTGSEHVLDLYCGAGSIALYLAGRAGFVTGVEIVPEAIGDANYNKALNGISNVEFILGRAEDHIEELMTQGKIPDLVIVDPPRKGCDESLLAAIGASAIQRMIYVSCDPATLARDVKFLAAHGFEPRVIQPYDNFPQTHHIETVVQLIRKEKIGE